MEILKRATTRRAAAAAAAAVLLLVALAGAAAAPAKTWVVKGGGFGHGVGMSAWGAYGYAKHGWGYERIIGHYYRRVKVKREKGNRRVRVLLATRSGDVKFDGAVKACGRKLKAGRTYRAQSRGSKVRLATSKGRRIAGCGGRLHAKSRGTVDIHGIGEYRGALEAVPSPGGLLVVNRLDVEDYVRGSLPGEIPPSWPKQSLKAFAIAIRSIALSTDVGGKAFDVYADTRTQVYGGVKLESKRTNRAAKATRGKLVTYKGKVIQSTYFSASGGRTESRFLGGPKVPYYRSVKDPYDHFSPQHRWTFRFSQAEMDSRLGPYVDGRLRKIKVLERGDSPRIDEARLVGSRGSTKVRGDTLQVALGLYDRWAHFKKR
ncbi:MAG: SpoIID/LytB domain-containing protein [Solirubrobacterales bacterium]|nr:SpoIID/LytB domain-containing protein [Solirubrobacterales bacterium]